MDLRVEAGKNNTKSLCVCVKVLPLYGKVEKIIQDALLVLLLAGWGGEFFARATNLSSPWAIAIHDMHPFNVSFSN